jgi:hypothetical protein
MGRDRIPPGGRFVGAKMPYFMRLTYDGVGLHAGPIPVPGSPASHGCIRMPHEVAPLLYRHVALGTPVTVTGRGPDYGNYAERQRQERAAQAAARAAAEAAPAQGGTGPAGAAVPPGQTVTGVAPPPSHERASPGAQGTGTARAAGSASPPSPTAPAPPPEDPALTAETEAPARASAAQPPGPMPAPAATAPAAEPTPPTAQLDTATSDSPVGTATP